MFRNYFKSTFRKLIKDKRYTLINVVGLSTGLVLFLTITLYVQRELSFDKHHEDYTNIYRVNSSAINENDDPEYSALSYEPLARTLMTDVPGVIAATRFFAPAAQLSFRSGDEMISIDDIFYADNDFFEIFDQEWVVQSETLLAKPNTTVISENLALRFFGKTDVLGETLTYEDPRQRHTVEVAGVFRETKSASHINYEMLISYESGVNFWKRGLDNNWRMLFVYTYFKSNGEVSKEALNSQISPLSKKYKGEETRIQFSSQEMASIYWNPLQYEPGISGNISYVYVFGTFALVVLILAAVNFVNLMTARSIRRSKEVAIRKIVGASQKGLVAQFLLESTSLAYISMLVAAVTVERLVPIINANYELQISFNLFQNLSLLLVVLFTPLGIGLLSGIYPALALSSFKANNLLKGKGNATFSNDLLRKGLLAFQFVISVLVISGVMMINKQMNFIKNEGLGFADDPIIVLPRIDNNSNYLIRQELSNELSIQGIASLSSIPGYRDPRSRDIKENGMTGDGIRTNGIWVSEDYAKILELEFLAGRNFGLTDQETAIILNERAVEDLGWEPDQAVSKRIVMTGRNGFEPITYEVVGVIRDYHYQSMFQNVEPLFLQNNSKARSGGDASLVKISKDRLQETLVVLEEKWNEIEKSQAFDYYFLDDAQNEVYQKEVKLSKTVSYVSGISILICFLGLFGLVSLNLESRKKEIGIRKVLGASGKAIAGLLSSSYSKIIVLSVIIGLPISYYFLDQWLSDFVYHINYSFGLYLAVGLGILLLSILLVGSQSIQASRVNPVQSLRED